MNDLLEVEVVLHTLHTTTDNDMLRIMAGTIVHYYPHSINSQYECETKWIIAIQGQHVFITREVDLSLCVYDFYAKVRLIEL